jgi:hypothetical protein
MSQEEGRLMGTKLQLLAGVLLLIALSIQVGSNTAIGGLLAVGIGRLRRGGGSRLPPKIRPSRGHPNITSQMRHDRTAQSYFANVP